MKDRRDTLYLLLLGVGSLALYLLTLCPTVYVGDSGEFITNAATLGINHPTGYPLYTLLSRLFVLLFTFLSPAVAVNLLSAVCAAATVVCCYSICRLLTSNLEIALACSLMYACSYTLWSRATTAEVYTLNMFVVALAMLFLLRWYLRGAHIDLVLTAYIVGLGLSQHITGALVAINAALLVLFKQPRLLLNVKLVLVLVAFIALGFSSYLYLPLRSIADPPIDWGNPEQLTNILNHLFPRSTAALLSDSSGPAFSNRTQWFAVQAASKEFWYVGTLALVGLVTFAGHWRLIVFFSSTIALNAYFTIVRKLPMHADFDAYFLPSYLTMAILIVITVNRLWMFVESRWIVPGQPVRRTVFHLAIFAPALVVLITNYRENDRSQNWLGHDFGKNLLKNVPEHAIVFTVGDEQTFTSWYFKYAEPIRPDITIIDRNLLGAKWGGSHMYNRELQVVINEREYPERLARMIVEQMVDKRPIVFTPLVPWDFMSHDYDFWHNGMLIQLLPKGSKVPDYQPTEFTLLTDLTNTHLDERCRLIIGFFYKEFLDNARYWFAKGRKDEARNELEGYLAFQYPKNTEDNGLAYLLVAQIAMDQKRYLDASPAIDSAAAYLPNDWRLHEIRGNLRFFQGDTAGAIRDWKFSLSYFPNNPTLARNIEILTKKRSTPPTTARPPRLDTR